MDDGPGQSVAASSAHLSWCAINAHVYEGTVQNIYFVRPHPHQWEYEFADVHLQWMAAQDATNIAQIHMKTVMLSDTEVNDRADISG